MVETVSYNQKFEVMFDSLFLGCAEETDEPDPGGGDESGHSSGSEGNKENAIAPKVLLSRRQKKNRVRKEDGDSPVLKKMTRKTSKRFEGTHTKRWNSTTGSRQHFKLNLDDSELSVLLRNYLLTPDQVMSLGYPIESSLYPGHAIIYKNSCPKNSMEPANMPRSPHLFDVNAREFVPSSCYSITALSKRKPYGDIMGDCNLENGQDRQSIIDGDVLGSSECTSSKSSDKSEEDRSCDSDLGEDKESDKNVTQTQQIIQRILKRYQPGSDEKKCVRCGRGFFVMIDGEYLTQEKCVYHWGKLQRVFGTNSNGVVSVKSEYSCCKGKKNSKGCSTAKLHVWSGVAAGVNGPLEGYVKTKPKKTSPPDGNYGVYSMDCEMCYTTQGLELTKITLVATDGRTVYDSFVKPENTIIDYNTRFSGITAKDLKKGNAAKNLKDVQNDLMGFINADTILIGHGLENDLKALKMIHSTVIDTSVIFPHYYGLPFRRSLKSLVNSFLKRDIQSCGHDSFEDARACMELMLWRVKKDFKNSFDNKNHTLVDKF
ncbi:hypothetical protein RUM44_008148 [Polyplax serrata]|uniref:Exonuclease domain-containing protein n=1 Tax=Polyplax serrata TaxID=468196 RepID=A0ABR1B7S1_POLSC